jgi:hypothetical protein
MAGEIGRLFVSIGAKADAFFSETKKVKSEGEKLEKGKRTVKVDADTKGANKALDGLKGKLGSLAKYGGFALLGAAAYELGDAFKSVAKKAELLGVTGAIIESTGGAAGVTSEHVTDLADSLEKMSLADDKAIQEGENLLLSFTNVRNAVGDGNNIFDQATKTALDMSQVLGQDVSASAMQLGKALNDPIGGVTALRRVGVQLTDEQKNQIESFMAVGDTLSAQKVILQELNKEFGGAAQAAQNAKPWELLKDNLDDLAENGVGKLMPVLIGLTDWLNNNMTTALIAVAGVATIYVGKLVAEWATAAKEIVVSIGKIIAKIGILNSTKAVADVGTVGTSAVGGAAGGLGGKVAGGAAGGGAAAAIGAGATVAIPAAIAALGAYAIYWNMTKKSTADAVVELWEMNKAQKISTEQFEQGVEAMGKMDYDGTVEGLQRISGEMEGEAFHLEKQAGLWDNVSGAIGDFAGSIGSKLSGAASTVGDFFKRFSPSHLLWEMTSDDGWIHSMVAGLIGKIGDAISGAGDAIDDAWNSVTGKITDFVSQLPGILAAGVAALPGIVWNGFWAIATGIGTTLAAGLAHVINFVVDVGQVIWGLPGTVTNAFWAVYNGISGVIVQLPGFVGGKFMEMVNAIWGAVASIPQRVANTFWEVYNGISFHVSAAISWLGVNLPKIPGLIADTFWAVVNHAQAGIAAMVDKISAGINSAVQWFADMPGRVLGALGDVGSWLVNTGEQLIQGLIDGIGNMAGAVWDKVTGLAGDVRDAFWDTLDFGSPSKVFMRMGEFIDQGLAQGMMSGQAIAASYQLAATVQAPAAAAAGNTFSFPGSNFNFPPGTNYEQFKAALERDARNYA